MSSSSSLSRFGGTLTRRNNFFAFPEKPTPCPKQVVVNLQTSILISDYSRYYDAPIKQFTGPSYLPLDDGSLVTGVFIKDLQSAYITLFLVTLLAVIFLRNTFVSANYIRRAQVPQKLLFYLLHLSQLIGCIGTFPQLVSFFVQEADCSVIILTTSLASAVSIAILMTGIIGYKAYKCLENSLVVAGTNLVLFIGSSVAAALDVIHTQRFRRLSGSCVRGSDLGYTRIYLVIQLLQSLFLCCCFLFAVWKSWGSPTSRSRMIMRLSLEVPESNQGDSERGRGPDIPSKRRITPNGPRSGRRPSVLLDIFARLRRACGISATRPQSATGDSLLRNTSEPSQCMSRTAGQRPFSAAPSSYSRISRYMPNMQLFRKVIKDELWYTPAITFTFVASAVLAVIGVNIGNNIPVVGWIGLTWAIMSILAMHSFGRVIARGEREAMLQNVLVESDLQRRIGRPRQDTSMVRRGSCSPSAFDHSDSPFSDGWRPDRSRGNSVQAESHGFPISDTKSPVSSLSSFDNLSITVPVCIPSPIAIPGSARAPYTPLDTPHSR